MQKASCHIPKKYWRPQNDRESCWIVFLVTRVIRVPKHKKTKVTSVVRKSWRELLLRQLWGFYSQKKLGMLISSTSVDIYSIIECHHVCPDDFMNPGRFNHAQRDSRASSQPGESPKGSFFQQLDITLYETDLGYVGKYTSLAFHGWRMGLVMLRGLCAPIIAKDKPAL